MSNEDRLAEALLPCPFCGGEPTKYPDPAVGVFVECQNDDCWSSPQVWGNDCQEAAYYWNRRSSHESRAEVSDAERLARKFHETYEWLAPKFGYETRPDTREFNPSSVNGRLMIAVCKHILITRSEENIDGI